MYIQPETDSSAVIQLQVLDSSTLADIQQVVNFNSDLLKENRIHKSDVQQIRSDSTSGIIFYFLLVLLIIIAYLKTAFSKDIEELLQSLVSNNMAQQVFRTKTDEWSFSSVLLTANFIIVFSLFMRYVVIHFYHTTTLNSFSSILFLNFLFTFFYLTKIFFVRILGWIFELSDAASQYIFHFTSSCKTVGLTLLPSLFIFYASGEKFFQIVFFISVAVIIAFALLLITRWLSTSLKLLYRSVYHFFIYVCVGEILILFLYLKLFTKTII
jgi:hypothetical protein